MPAKAVFAIQSAFRGSLDFLTGQSTTAMLPELVSRHERECRACKTMDNDLNMTLLTLPSLQKIRLKTPAVKSFLDGRKTPLPITTKNVSVNVPGLVKLTNRVWDSCNSPWGHMTGDGVNPIRVESWHGKYIDNVIKRYTQVVEKPKKRVVTVLSPRITGVDADGNEYHETRTKPGGKLEPQLTLKSKKRKKKKRLSIPKDVLPMDQAPAKIVQRRNGIFDHSESTSKGREIWGQLSTKVQLAGLFRTRDVQKPHIKLLTILKKNPLARTSTEREYLFGQFRELDAFKKLEDSILRQMEGVHSTYLSV